MQIFRKKRKGTYLLLELAVLFVIFTFVFGGALVLGEDSFTAAKCDYLRHQAREIDRALDLYSDSHKSIGKLHSVKGLEGEEVIQAREQPCYPKTLAELRNVMGNGKSVMSDSSGYEYGYFTKAIGAIYYGGDFLTDTSLDSSSSNMVFYYKAYGEDSSNDEVHQGSETQYTSYVLAVKLPNGTVYTSPGSSKKHQVKWDWK